jgi:GNAT superfamily N-acetyltransferase
VIGVGAYAAGYTGEPFTSYYYNWGHDLAWNLEHRGVPPANVVAKGRLPVAILGLLACLIFYWLITERVQNHVPIDILGYLDDKPVAWCSIALRATYRPLGGEAQTDDDSEQVWSLVCFFVSRVLRGQGVLKQLIQASVDHACKHGAKVVEAYPVDPDSPSYRFMGFKPSCEAAGFREVGRAGSRRYVMRFEPT